MKTSPLEYAQKTELLYLIATLQAALFAPMLALLVPASAADVPLRNACSPTYTLTDLGTLSGYRLSTGAAINAQGDMAGLCFNGPGDNLARAFFYRRGELIDLGAQIGPDTRTQVTSINVRNQIVGQVYVNAIIDTKPITSVESFLYNYHLGTVETFSVGVNTYASSINNHRQIVGYFDQGPNTLPHAFLRQPDSTVVVLGTFGGTEAVATQINDRGEIVGWFFGVDSRYHAFLTQQSGGASQDLGSLDTSTNTYAYAVNNLGDIVGSSGVLDSSGTEQSHAFFYATGELRDLGTLGGASSYAYGINDLGQIVGYSELAGGSTLHAFIYLEGQMRDLNDLIRPATTSSLFNASDSPATTTENDPNPVELGVKFQSSVAGTITAIRFYKGPQNTGTHVGNLWSAVGMLLATATFSSESTSGWQQVNLSSPIAITPGTTYVVSYHTNRGLYSVNNNYFTSAHANGPLMASDSSSSGGNGVYAYGNTSNFPTSTYLGSNYWVDVVFNASSPPGSGWMITEAHSINNRSQIAANALSSDATILHAVLLSPHL
jgi:probable HAF family extracellular repeat protein